MLQREAPVIAVEPRPRLALRVGGIGHRQFPDERSGAIATTLRTVFAVMERAALQARANAPAAFSGPLDFSVTTPLAEGADRLIAAAAVLHGLSLGAVLPFARSDYENTFDLAPDRAPIIEEFRRLLGVAAQPEGHGVLVLDGECGTESQRNISYRECAAEIVRRSDFLIGIVERTRLQSESGATLQQAMARRVPVILIHPEQPETFRLLLRGRDVFETEDQGESLRAEVQRVIAACSLGDPESQRCLRDYCAEDLEIDQPPDKEWAFACPFHARTVAPPWISWCTGLNARLGAILRRRPGKPEFGEPPDAPASPAEALAFSPRTAAAFANLTSQFFRADQAANAYAELQRSSHILLAILGALIAILSSVDLVLGTGFPFISIVIVLVLLYVGGSIFMSNHQRWLERWIDYRLLAEIMRAGTFLLVAGETAPFDIGKPARRGDEARQWVRSYAGAVFRAEKIAVPGREIDVDPLAVEKARNYINDNYARGQIDYHRRTARKERKLGRLLEVVSLAVAALIGLVAVLNVAVKYALISGAVSHEAEAVLAILLIFLPALAAVLVALRGYNQYEVVAQRSGKMAAVLAEHLEESSSATSLRSLGVHTLAASRIILHDVEGWTDIFASKRLEF